MPNYDIIPLAVDLLDYTIQRVKTKEPEYRKVKALVQENGQLAERELFEKIRDDGNRAAALREAKRAHELAKMSQMAQQIAEAMVKHS